MLPTGLPEITPVDTGPILSLPQLRMMHSALIQRLESSDASVKPTLGEILGFIEAAVGLGEVLKEPRLREAAQGPIDFWTGILLSQAPQVAETSRSFRLKEFSKESHPLVAEAVSAAQEKLAEGVAVANEIVARATDRELNCLRAILTRMIRLKASSLNVYTVPIPAEDDIFSGEVALSLLKRLKNGDVIREQRLDGEPAYTLADEKLITNWEFLAKIVAARKALRELARAWDRSERSGTGLLSSGQHLDDASTYRDLNPVEEEFVKTSRNRKGRLQKRIIWAIGISTVIAVTLLVLYVLQLNSLLERVRAETDLAKQKTEESKENAKRANERAEKAESELAALRSLTKRLPIEATEVSTKAEAIKNCSRLTEQGEELQKNGKLEEAKNAYTQSSTCQEELVAKYNDDNELRFQLSSTFNSLGNVCFDLNNYADALLAFEKGLKIRRTLSEQIDPKNPRWKLGKFYSLLYISDVARRLDPAKALAPANEALLIAGGMVDSDPKNSSWRTELSIAQEQVKRLQSEGKK